MNELRYRVNRLHALAAAAAVMLISTSLLGWLVSRDLALPGQVRAAGGSSQGGQGTPAGTGGPAARTAKPAGASGAAGPSGPAASGRTAGVAAGARGDVGPVAGQVTIGAVITQSGLGDETPVYKGLDAALKYVNSQGGAKGVKMNLKVLDDGTDPNRGQADLRQLVEQDKVFALVGECAPLTDFDAGNYFAQQEIPVVGPCFAPNAMYSNPYVFPFVVEPQIEGELMGSFLVGKMGSSKPAVVSLDVNVLDQSYAGIAQGFQKAGKSPCDAEKVPVTQASMDTVVLNELQKGCDGVVMNLDAPHILSWLQAAQRYNYKPKRVSLTGFEQTIVDNGGSGADGLVTFFGQLLPSAEGGSAAVATYRRAMASFHPEEKDLNGALPGWLAGISFAEAIGQINGAVTRRSLIQTLESATISNGFEPPVHFGAGSHAAATECRFYQLNNGSFQPITGWYGG